MKLCVVADLHLIQNDPLGNLINTKPDEYGKINSRLYKKLNNLKTVVNYVLDNNIKLFILAGDTFDIPNPSKELRRLFFNTIQPLLDNEVNTIFILGNHELSSTSKNPFSDIDKLDINYFYVIDKIYNLEYHDNKILLVNWGASEDKLLEYDTDNILIGHLPVKGEYMNDNIVSKEGISKEVLNKFSLVRLGHFHKRNAYYIGCLNRRGFGDKDKETGFEVIDLDLPKVDYIPVDDTNFVEIVINEDNLDSGIINDFNDNDIVKIKLEGSKSFVKSVKYSNIWKEIKCSKILFDTPKITDKLGSTNMDKVNIEDNIKEYAKEKNIGKKLMNIGLNLYKNRS